MLGIKDKFPHLPEEISGLRELAYNLWWSWHPEGRGLFKLLSRQGWYLSNHNPVKMLNRLDEQALKAACSDPHFMRHYEAVMARFESYMDPSGGWFCRSVAGPDRGRIAYFSAEYGLHHALPFYAGGLGFLAGDFLKECSDLGVPLIAVGFMYPQGYLRQMISPEGWQMGACELLDRENAPIRKILDSNGEPLSIKIPVMDPPVYLEVWKVNVGKTSLYLIDTSSEANDPWNRIISDRLYTGDLEQRLRQEIVLGIGGVCILRALGIEYSALHCNEGHPAFAVLERIRERVEAGMSYRDAFEEVKDTTVFTTHTPVPAGHDVFSYQLMDKYFGTYLPALDLSRDEFFRLGTNPARPEGFNMTAFALRSSAFRNAVSKKHGEVSRSMWQQLWPELSVDKVPIDYITNGVHVPSWIDRRLGDVIFNRYLGRTWLEEHDHPATWKLIDEMPDSALWEHHMVMKEMLIAKIRERARNKWRKPGADSSNVMASGVLLESAALTLGFARRFASYKRPTLLLQDMARLAKIVADPWRPVQIIFAGKAHQDDQQSKQLLQQVFNAARDQTFGGRIAYVEDYDELLAQYLVHGVDVWVNNPLPPMEASGTSGMKATLNGVPQLSILDGWWIEGYNGRNGWAVQGADGPERDGRDASAIYDLLEKEIVPLYYDVDEDGLSHGWVKVMKEAIKVTGHQFSARRMAKEYANRFYSKALAASMKAERLRGRSGGKADLFGGI
ncbi:MAG TPA: alpha-glucan family phosphorylase [Methanothrix sp.]|nr:alpha-glucan family phosphorylase [Methanothrix sp.]HPT19318.1 alpha-glucan family phosphorylase [Methanothrix sp.]